MANMKDRKDSVVGRAVLLTSGVIFAIWGAVVLNQYVVLGGLILAVAAVAIAAGIWDWVD